MKRTSLQLQLSSWVIILVPDSVMLTPLMTIQQYPDTIINCLQVVAQVMSIFCSADVLEVRRSGWNCLHATSTSLSCPEIKPVKWGHFYVYCIALVQPERPSDFLRLLLNVNAILSIFSGVTDQETSALCSPATEMGRLLMVAWRLACLDGHSVWFAATSGTNVGNEVTLAARSVRLSNLIPPSV